MEDDDHLRPLAKAVANDPNYQRLKGFENSPLQQIARAMANDPLHQLTKAMANDPLQQIAKALANDPIHQLAKTMANDPMQQLIRSMADDPLQRSLRAIVNRDSAFGGLQHQVSALQAALGHSTLADSIGNIHKRYDLSPFAHELAFPAESAAMAFGRQIAHVVEPYNSLLSSFQDWEKRLGLQVSTIENQWGIPDQFAHSMVGFARLSRLSQVIQTAEPYAEATSEIVNDELGAVPSFNIDDPPISRDEAALKAGLNPGLIAFNPDTYDHVIVAAGFTLTLTKVSIPPIEVGADPGGIFDPSHHAILLQVEQGLRQAIETHLLSNYGINWIKQRVSENTRSRWVQRQSEELDYGRPAYSLIQYADFMDLLEIICRKDNWIGVFHSIFLNKDDFSTSLRRLHPIRKALAHSRPLGRADVLTLHSEATRILLTLGLGSLG